MIFIIALMLSSSSFVYYALNRPAISVSSECLLMLFESNCSRFVAVSSMLAMKAGISITYFWWLRQQSLLVKQVGHTNLALFSKQIWVTFVSLWILQRVEANPCIGCFC